ncbi:glycosyltransferase family 32 protein [Aspergillus clavatus NRRL 1]|uniref:Glycosyl transferase, putative n=1 Tax=Aspergillus clavatus (strain ATCC 1007 / CBS 513.65 / DSM 816 / NCTC 3887 / NRRL 1 / QM 1276 / 107) TaxID=344612 RepID=A1C8L7_ASPCL|nr:glycosyl transferase, putative [Aspergillus clavatus NRRL 1]EAW13654.1 glycosyl transferase, putative [Aspergillus clavatus NRRL 1]
MPPRWRFKRQVIVSGVVLLAVIWLLLVLQEQPPVIEDQEFLLAKYVHSQEGKGGAWYIPNSWLEDTTSPPQTIVEAAKLASRRAQALPQRQLPYSAIPLIVHQTWKNTQPETWSPAVRHSTEQWLRAVETDGMAYFLWDDEGIKQFMLTFEPALQTQFYALSSNVERTDVFRILVSKWIGGVYGDMDTEPLRNPAHWIDATDIQPWQDPRTNATYNSTASVRAIIGLEADCPPDGDSYWRMGYTYPVQLTQWSFAWAPGHPILQRFVETWSARMRRMSSGAGMRDWDPLMLTGPAAFTEAVQGVLNETAGLRWNALTGLEDGGRSCLVLVADEADSPGRGKYGNMGSKPLTDPSARLLHRAQGSWRKFDLVVEYGKFCRTVFGRCRGWTKVPHS